MKSLLLIILSCAMMSGHAVSAESSKWTSPSGSCSLQLTYGEKEATHLPTAVLTAISKTRTGPVRESPLIDSPISREFGGITWFSDVKPRWIENRYLIFEAEDRLAVIDVEANEMILCTAFSALAKDGDRDRWSAIRLRPIARKQSVLAEKFRDTLFVIDLPQVIRAHAAATGSSEPFGHLKSIQLPGNALTKPRWFTSPGQSRLALAIWADGQIKALAIDPQTLAIIAEKPLAITVQEQAAHSAWIDQNAEPEIAAAALAALSKSGDDTPGSQITRMLLTSAPWIAGLAILCVAGLLFHLRKSSRK